jgi:hypothetical protein
VKLGVGNKNVDYLSRLEEDQVVNSICTNFLDEDLFAVYVEKETPALPDELNEQPGPLTREAGTQYDPEDLRKGKKRKAPKTLEEEYKEITDYLTEGKIPP